MNEQTPNSIRGLLSGIETVWRADEGMGLSCLRTFLTLCVRCETEGSGVPVLRLAAMLDTPRTNVTRHLKFLRARGFIGSERDLVDGRVELSMPTENGWRLYDELKIVE